MDENMAAYYPPAPPPPPGQYPTYHQPPPLLRRLSVAPQAPSPFATYAAPFAHHSTYDVVRTLFVAGLPEDVKPREIYNLFREFPGYESSRKEAEETEMRLRPVKSRVRFLNREIGGGLGLLGFWKVKKGRRGLGCKGKEIIERWILFDEIENGVLI
ncbi:RNA-binding protein with multiple splicing [Euphorbia peplus]|nr:RNA-binding protein with multiple splicing [Euphorbia peplus]